MSGLVWGNPQGAGLNRRGQGDLQGAGLNRKGEGCDTRSSTHSSVIALECFNERDDGSGRLTSQGIFLRVKIRLKVRRLLLGLGIKSGLRDDESLKGLISTWRILCY